MFKLPSFSFVALVLSLPLRYSYFVIKYYVYGTGSFVKYQNSLEKFLSVSMITTIYNNVQHQDLHFLANYQISFTLNLFKRSHSSFVKEKLPGYGEKYDANSTWLVKSDTNDSNDPVIVYLHGGGYAYQLGPSQLETVISTYLLLDPSKRSKVSILILDYKLSSMGFKFPTQRDQLHETYQNLTIREGYKNITLIGDSAGGHLALEYLQYLKSLTQDKLIDAEELETEKVIFPTNLVLVSPWVRVLVKPDQYVPGISHYDNRNRDIIRYGTFSKPEVLQSTFGDALYDSVGISPLSNPFSINDWNDIPTIKSNVLILAGEYETLRDDVLEFAENVFGCPAHSGTHGAYEVSDGNYHPSIHEFKTETENGKIGFELFVEPWGVHDAAFLFESAISKLNKGNIDVNDLEEKDFFGLKKIVNFLNEAL
ncbi:putative steryl acetyl hydrolase mug81 [[Candida] railenensis]|uniref:Steryl acetyl hydrolase mug81 n=1 Tax=[Candida] railenensis TaxID=45579 RepID=A0A9P0QUK9_9ASCO|nr:putative steryl acetyl hydrolase mug81 [[Candida] railenensis]